MMLNRTTFFLLLLLPVITVTVVPKIVWLYRSEKATAIFSFQGRGDALDQFPQRNSYLYFFYQNHKVWFKGPPGLGLHGGSRVSIRFQPDDPEDAKIDSFYGLWLSAVVYSALPSLLLLVCFLQPQIIPWRSKVLLIPRKPFIIIIPQTNALNSYVDLPFPDTDK